MKKSVTRSDANATAAREFTDRVFGEQDLDAIEEYVSAETVMHLPTGEEVRGVEGHRAYFAETFEAFPDMELAVRELAADGDWVIFRFEARGTHDGPMPVADGLAIEPTGERAAWQGFVSIRFADGEMAEAHVLTDALGTLQQLGVFDASETAA